MSWMTPAALDRERWRWRRWKGQRGGWNQPLWIRLQAEWWQYLQTQDVVQ